MLRRESVTKYQTDGLSRSLQTGPLGWVCFRVKTHLSLIILLITGIDGLGIEAYRIGEAFRISSIARESQKK